MNLKPKINRFGERSILLQWDFKIAPENLFWLLEVKDFLDENIIKSTVYINNTYNSLLINYNYSIEYVYDDLKALHTFDFSSIKSKIYKGNLYKIPVCYDLEFGLDLEALSALKSLTVSEVIQLHTAPIYTLYFMGFLPGFLYLGGMDNRLATSRKNEPRKAVSKGAVGIAENQTGIYPKSSPAGWQIIGNSPINLFDVNAEKPSIFEAGDRIKFHPISKQEYDQINDEIDNGNFQLNPEIDE
ncbi:5-oxoprolinase subunit PxpB [Leeuwenhoekiella sp. NPDC079379]|uniref:5-oxoprolinase subunit PxpB n=1 Tax=Leeuwenhoekiella sp. NPDC079379 TaxID=3364122 RepID=UPI0037C61255